MLGVNKYSQDYVDQTRARLEADIAAYNQLNGSAPAGFEATFFNNLVIVLDHHFCHRLRTLEGKDGNPLNEVRVLADSLMAQGGTFTANKTIRMKPAESLLKYEVGDEIKLTEADFRLLADGFLAEIERKFS